MNNPSSKYHPESYWSEVATRIQSRGNGNIVAGDDTPYYRYKRKRFLSMLHSLSIEGKKVLEIGHGPGGNLIEIIKRNPESLTGVDISDQMINLARENLQTDKVKLVKTNGTNLNFPEQTFDIVFSATVLQHNSDEEMMKAMLSEMFRVSSDLVVLFERIEKKLIGDDLCVGRPVEYYAAVAESCGFRLKKSSFINIQVSYLVSGAIRKLFNSKERKEGESLSSLSIFLQKVSLPITSILDRIFRANRDLGQLVFERKS